MIRKAKAVFDKKMTDIYNKEKITMNKINIKSFVEKADSELKLNGTLTKYDFIEHFRVFKDTQEISLESFLQAYLNAVLERHEISEDMVKMLIV